jgi:hypothetical protein
LPKGYTYLALVSTVAGTVNTALASRFFIWGTDWLIRLITFSVLGFVSLTMGLISRFGRAKDNLGAAGIVLTVTALISYFYTLVIE